MTVGEDADPERLSRWTKLDPRNESIIAILWQIPTH
jgi:hypothetical protein